MAIDIDNNFWFGTDIGLMRYNETGIDNIDDQQAYETISSFSITPNPSSDFLEITKPSEGWEHSEGSANAVRIFNVFGETVKNLTPTLSEGDGGKNCMIYIKNCINCIPMMQKIQSLKNRYL